jgi:glycerol-3-phosphate dehydrogenase
VKENSLLASYDVAVVGAGINGAVSAAALSARGLKVLIIDRGDFASVTSSQSSNLIWGGIKYLQSYEFWLVFKLCVARARLMKSYPTRIKSVGFFAALGPNAPFGKILGTLGTLFYWAIGLFTTPAPRTHSLKNALATVPNLGTNRVRGAVEYFDGMMPDNDARFVWDFVHRAHQLGATTLNYHELVGANRTDQGFDLEITDLLNATKKHTQVKVLINAAGPYVKNTNSMAQVSTRNGLVFSKGIHLVVPKLTSDDRILAFWDEQGRLFYVIPMHDRSVIGTTDTRVDDPAEQVTDEDRQFVLRQINVSMNLTKPLTTKDIISERCGVRALVVNQGSTGDGEDWHKLSRKHVVELDPSGAISILGGKFTDCLNVGDEIVRAVSKYLKMPAQQSKWFGEDPKEDFALLLKQATDLGQDELVSGEILHQLWRRHGAAARQILTQLSQNPSDRELVFDGLAITYGELRHIVQNEQVGTRDDLLRRRLPISMVRSSEEIRQNARLQQFLGEVGLL